MQLSDVLKDTDATEEAYSEMRFQEYLARLSALPVWKKKELEREMKKMELTHADVMRIINGGDDWPPDISSEEHGEMVQLCGDERV